MIRLGDPVEVELESVDPLHRDIDLRYCHTRTGARRGRGSGGVPATRLKEGRPQRPREEEHGSRKPRRGATRHGRSGKKKGGPGKGRRRTHG
jgi:hypothetical protein